MLSRESYGCIKTVCKNSSWKTEECAIKFSWKVLLMITRIWHHLHAAIKQSNIWVVTSYVLLQLIFQPGEVKLQVRAVHQFLAPACNFCNYPWRHVHNESIRTIQKIQERTPYWFSLLWRMFTENFYTWMILLK